MKKQRFWTVAGLAFILSSMVITPAQAVMFRMLDAPALGRLAATNGSMAFKGKVTKIEQTADGQSVTFLIQDALKGKAKTGESVTLQFPNQKFNQNMRIANGFPPPTVGLNTEGVFFTTTRGIDGRSFLIGGDQGQYFIGHEGGREVVYNRLGNANFYSAQQMNNPLMKKIVQGMHERNSGTIPYDDFKRAINQ